MALTEQINNDIKTAMLNKEKDRLNALRAIKSALLLEATKGSTGEIDEETGIKILQKLYKQRVEAAEIYRQQNREDLLAEESLQADVISSYLPKPMGEEELEKAVKDIVQETGASSPGDMGKVMGVAQKKLAGRVDGKKLSEVVRRVLTS